MFQSLAGGGAYSQATDDIGDFIKLDYTASKDPVLKGYVIIVRQGNNGYQSIAFEHSGKKSMFIPECNGKLVDANTKVTKTTPKPEKRCIVANELTRAIIAEKGNFSYESKLKSFIKDWRK